MADPTIIITAEVDTTSVRTGAGDFASLKDRVKELAGSLPGVGGALTSLMGAFDGAAGGAAGAGASIAGMAAAAGVAVVAMAGLGIAMAFQYADVIDGFGDMGEAMGISADQAYFLSTAAEQAGGSLSDLSGIGEKLSKAMSNSGDEMKGAGLAFKRLGVDINEAGGKMKSTETVAYELIDAWDKSNKTASDYADMMQVMGKGFEEKIPVITAVKQAQEAANEAYEAGIGISKQAIEATGEQEKQNLKLGNVMNSMGSTMVELVIPAWNGLTSWFVRSYTEGGIVAKTFTLIAVATEVVMIVVKALATGFLVLSESMSMFGDIGTTVFKALFQALKGDGEGAMKTLAGGFDKVGERAAALAVDIKKIGLLDFSNSTIMKLLNGEDVINRKGDLNAPTGNVIKGNGGGSQRPEKDDKEKVDDTQKAIEGLIGSLNKQMMAQDNLNKVEMVSKELLDKKYDSASAANKAAALAAALSIDNSNANKLLNASTMAITKIGEDYADNLNDEIRAKTIGHRQMKEEQELNKIAIEQQRQLNTLANAGLLTTARRAKVDEDAAEARRKVEEATKKAKETDDDWFGNGMAQYAQSTGTLNEQLQQLTVDSIGGLTQSFTALFSGGTTGFKDLARNIIKSLLDMAVQFLIITPIIEKFQAVLKGTQAGGGGYGAFASAIGSMFSSQGNTFVKHNAQGDIASSATMGFFGNGQSSIYGEAGDEAVMPLKRTAGGDLGVIVAGGGGGRGGNTQINNITINGADGSNVEENRRMGAMLSAMIDKKWQENESKANRPGGSRNTTSLRI